jgi:hypothetical protein
MIDKFPDGQSVIDEGRYPCDIGQNERQIGTVAFHFQAMASGGSRLGWRRSRSDIPQ